MCEFDRLGVGWTMEGSTWSAFIFFPVPNGKNLNHFTV